MTTTRMRAEIGEQPEALRRTIDALLPRVPDLAALAGETRQVLFIARGSSDNAAVYGRYLVESHAGRLASLAAPSIATTYRGRLDLDGVLAVAISQSGKTEEIVETLDWAAGCGARTVAITNGEGSPLAESAEVALITEAGAEIAVPATKTYTTQLAALAVLAIGLGAQGGGGPAGGGEPLDIADLRRAPDEVARLIELTEASDQLPEIVAELAEVQGTVVSGRGIAFGTALELALKIKEACYLHAMGLSYADLLHGPIAVVDDRTPALLVAADSGPTLPGTVALAHRVRDAGARAYGVGGGPGLAAACSRALPGPDLPEWVAPLGLIVPGQILVEALARGLGADPDVPRGLNKVTQTD
ncbi:SIS domain-containing protein [Actinomadura sp. SCN-SB]|uniref:SIS domain-containing protein n=1 Tax=Actinomadura sp. SCN-SB TaxID=3373092 RepID=UPI003752649A